MIFKLTIDLYLRIESYFFTCQLLIFLDKIWKFWPYRFYWMPPVLENYLGTTFLRNSLIPRNTSQGTKNNRRYKTNQLQGFWHHSTFASHKQNLKKNEGFYLGNVWPFGFDQRCTPVWLFQQLFGKQKTTDRILLKLQRWMEDCQKGWIWRSYWNYLRKYLQICLSNWVQTS